MFVVLVGTKSEWIFKLTHCSTAVPAVVVLKDWLLGLALVSLWKLRHAFYSISVNMYWIYLHTVCCQCKILISNRSAKHFAFLKTTACFMLFSHTRVESKFGGSISLWVHRPAALVQIKIFWETVGWTMKFFHDIQGPPRKWWKQSWSSPDFYSNAIIRSEF